MTDSLELEDMLKHTNLHEEPMYEKVEYVQLFDNQSGNYTSGQIGYNTDQQMKNHVVYSDSYLALPLQVAMGTAGRIAVKNSVLSLIQGVQIESAQGTQICNDQISTPIVNNLKLLIDSSIDFIEGNELMYFGKDQKIEVDASGAGTSVVGGVTPSCSSGQGLAFDRINFLTNPALCNRISVFAKRATVTPAPVATQSVVAYIPLKFIHSFFEQMSFPMVNLSLRITFNIAGVGSYTAYNPWTCPNYPAHSTLGPAAAPVAPANLAATLQPSAATPVITGTTVLSTFGGVVGDSSFSAVVAPRLFLKTVYFQAKQAAELKAAIVKGYSKTLVYRNTNWYYQQQAAGNGQVNWPFVQGIIRPTRIWVFPVAAGTLASSSNCFPASIGQNYLYNTNILLNGNNFYNNWFLQPYDYYREFKTQLIGAASSTACATPISYTDWLTGMNPYCFDLSRNPTVKTNNLCSLTLVTSILDQQTNAPPAAAIDLWVIVERLQTVTLKVSEGGVEIVTKQGAPDDHE